MKQSDLKPGDKVIYNPDYGKLEKGIVKSLDEHDSDYVFVVYHWDGESDNYEDYTAARTRISDLTKGWN